LLPFRIGISCPLVWERPETGARRRIPAMMCAGRRAAEREKEQVE
jgi:hypothetical protein